MVITCPECSTRFNVADERIPEAGAKLRCARCRHVFMVHRPVSEEPEKENPQTTEKEQTITDFSSEPDEVTPDKPSVGDRVDPFSSDQATLPDDPASFSDIESNDSEFDYDRFRELDTNDSTVEEFTFGNDEELAPPPITDSEPTLDITKDMPAPDVEQQEAKELASAPPKKKKASSPPGSSAFSILIKIILLIILAALVIGGTYIYLDGPEEINNKFKQYFGQTIEESPGINQISLGTLEGRFLTNEQAGELFLIRGEAINNFGQPRSAIQVKGVLYDQHGKPLMQKTVFCGNPITDEELRTLPFDALEQMMGNQFGKDLRNMKVDPRKSISFDIVFKDLPANISEFSVNVTSSRPTER